MSAVLSVCGAYRYRLSREVSDGGPVAVYIGVNPSTADATKDDATVRKWFGFAHRMGASRFIVGNLFGFRATDVRELAKAADPVGRENDEHLRTMLAQADVVIPCWGSSTKLPPRLRYRVATVRGLLRDCGKPIRTFGLTASGDPRHPLMLGYATPLAEWSHP